MVDLGHERIGRERRVEHVVEVDRQQVEQALLARGRDGVRGVVDVGPRVRALREAAVRDLVEDPLERVLLAAEEDEVLESVRQPVVLVAPVVRDRFGREHGVQVAERRLGLEEHHAQARRRAHGHDVDAAHRRRRELRPPLIQELARQRHSIHAKIEKTARSSKSKIDGDGEKRTEWTIELESGETRIQN